MEVTIAKGMTKEECERAVDKNLNTPNLRFMMEKMAEAGCPIDRSFFTVDDCKEHEGKVVACHNELMSEDDVGSMMMHELIHAYDHCRGKSLEWTNCVHHACSEIRAANLSGDCLMWKELARGHINIAGQGVRCVKRRAELSVAMNPFCQRPGQARQAVDTAFPMCYPDTAPFDRAYH